jgi:hypothetical protein
MPSREYEVEAENVLPEGFWPGEPLQADADAPNALENLMLRAAVVLEMVGGVFTVAAIRKQIGPDLWVPDSYVAKWESYAPGRRAAKQPPLAHEAPEPPTPEPEASGSEDEDFGVDAERALAEAGG